MDRERTLAYAERLLGRNRVEDAIAQYELVLAEHPGDVVLMNRIGDLWVKLGRNRNAVHMFRRIADHYTREGFFLKAIAILKKINRIDASDLTVFRRLAELYARQNLPAEARAQFQVLADYYIRHTDYAAALEIYRRIEEIDEDSIDVLTQIAELQARIGDLAGSASAYRAGMLRVLHRRGPNDVRPLLLSALRHHREGRDLVAWFGEVLLRDGHYTAAVAVLEQAIDTTDLEPDHAVLLGRARIATGDHAGARALLESTLEKHPHHEGLRKSLASLALIAGDSGRALDLVTPLMPERPAPPAVTPAAAPSAPPAPAPPPHEDNVIAELLQDAETYARYGLAVPAMQQLEAVLARNPTHRGALRRMVEISLAEEKTEAAMRLAVHFFTSAIGDAQWDEVDGLGRELRERGLLEEVLKALPPDVRALRREAPADPPPMPATDHPEAAPEPAAAPAAAEAALLDEEIEIDLDLEPGEPAPPRAADPVVIVSEAEEIALQRELRRVQRLLDRRQISRAAQTVDNLLLRYRGHAELMRMHESVSQRVEERNARAGRKRARRETVTDELDGTQIPDSLDVN